MTAADASSFRNQTTSQKRDMHWLVLVFLIMLLLPLSKSVGGIVLTTLRLTMVLVVIPLAIGLLRGTFGRILPTDWLFLSHTLWMGASLIVTSPDMAVSQFGSVGAEFLGSYLVGRTLVRDREQFLSVTKFLIWAAVLLTPFAAIEMVTSHPPLILLLDKIPVLDAPTVVWTEKRLHLDRAQVLFAHPIHWGLFCSALFTITFIGRRSSDSLVKRVLLTGMVGFGTFTSLASGALLPVILQLGLISWSLVTDRVKNRWWILIGFIFVGWIILEMLSNRSAIMAVLSRLAFSTHNVYYRSIIFDWGWMNIFGSVENGIPPARLFGIGFNEWIRPSYMRSGSMDNFWLVMGVRHGIPGFLTVAGGMGWLIWKAARHDMGADRGVNDIRLAWVLTLICLGLSMATVHVWGTIYDYIFFLLGAGAWLTTYEPAAETGAEPMARSSLPGGRRRSVYSRFGGRAPSAAKPSAAHSSPDSGPGLRPVLLRQEDPVRSYRRPAPGAPDSPTSQG